MDIFLVKLAILVVFQISTADSNPDTGLNIYEFLEKYGYPVESHQVETEDGYILTLHRIPSRHPAGGVPILVMAGLMCSSMDFVNLGPGKAFALLLSDAGFDVWLGNQRGNTWSRKHVYLNPDSDKKKFFNFSWHEIGIYDLPAIIDYILNYTNQDTLNYSGHSQGVTEFFVMASERPEYLKKVRTMSGMAPPVFLGRPATIVNTVILRLLGKPVKYFLEFIGAWELLPYNWVVKWFNTGVCIPNSFLCLLLLTIFSGPDFKINKDFMPVLFSNYPAGSSLKQWVHYGQIVESEHFNKFDFGRRENLRIYGQDTPPSYNLSKVQNFPISLYYGKNDQLATPEGAVLLVKSLRNVVSKEVDFNHGDFLWSYLAAESVYDEIISGLKKQNMSQRICC